jgi:molybdopterin-dependent oxidoreductase alpha subunit
MATFGSTDIASTYYQVKVGGDAAALKGIMKAMMKTAETIGGVLDHEFIAEHTNGFVEFAADLRRTEWADIEKASGLMRSDLEKVATAYIKSKATIVTYGMGITQHSKGTQNVQQIAALLMLRGNYGKPGAGICPLRGHSNVQGNRTVGITEKPDEAMFDRIEHTFGFRPPPHHGHDAVNAMKAMIDGRSKALVCLGGNFSIALPDTDLSYQGMRNLDLAVHLNTKLNRSHLLVGKESIILPVLGSTEREVQADGLQSVTIEYSLSRRHASWSKLPRDSDHVRSGPRSSRASRGDSAGQQGRLAKPCRRLRPYPRQIEAVYLNSKIQSAHPSSGRSPPAGSDRRSVHLTGKAEFCHSPALPKTRNMPARIS